MSRINRVPKGLQDLLGSQNFGDNPSELGAVVAPTMDLSTFFKMDRRTIHLTAGASAAVDGVIASVTLPQGEAWMIESLAIRVALAGAAAPYQAQFSCTTTNTLNSTGSATTHHPLCYLGAIEPNANATVSSGYFAFDKFFGTPIVMFGGESIHWVINNGDYSGTKTYPCYGYVRYTKLLV